MAGVSIRHAVAADLPDLTEIYNHYVRETPVSFDTEPFGVEQRRPWLEGFAETGLLQRFGFTPVGTFREVGWKLGRHWDLRWFEKPM